MLDNIKDFIPQSALVILCVLSVVIIYYLIQIMKIQKNKFDDCNNRLRRLADKLDVLENVGKLDVIEDNTTELLHRMNTSCEVKKNEPARMQINQHQDIASSRGEDDSKKGSMYECAKEEFVALNRSPKNRNDVIFDRGADSRENLEPFKINYKEGANLGTITMAADYSNMITLCAQYEKVVDVDKEECTSNDSYNCKIISEGKVHLDEKIDKWVLDEKIKIKLN